MQGNFPYVYKEMSCMSLDLHSCEDSRVRPRINPLSTGLNIILKTFILLPAVAKLITFKTLFKKK